MRLMPPALRGVGGLSVVATASALAAFVFPALGVVTAIELLVLSRC